MHCVVQPYIARCPIKPSELHQTDAGLVCNQHSSAGLYMQIAGLLVSACNAPLYLRTLWHYTNAVIIIIIMISATTVTQINRQLLRQCSSSIYV